MGEKVDGAVSCRTRAVASGSCEKRLVRGDRTRKPRGVSAMVWLNGELVAEEEAMVSALGRGWTVGYGVFETLLALDGNPFALTRHYRRLGNSAGVLDLPIPDLPTLRQACHELLSANCPGAARARVRITVGEAPGEPAVTVTATAIDPPAPSAAVVLSPYVRNAYSALAGVKAMSYAENTLALAEARARGADEAILANTGGHLCEGTASNLFVVRAGNVLTPPLASGCLPGVTRELVLEVAQAGGIPCMEADMMPDSLAEADEAFLTSSTRGIQPIHSVEGSDIPAPGVITRRLQEAFLALQETQQDP